MFRLALGLMLTVVAAADDSADEAAYVFGEPNTNHCPSTSSWTSSVSFTSSLPLTSASQCEAAAKSLGLTWQWPHSGINYTKLGQKWADRKGSTPGEWPAYPEQCYAFIQIKGEHYPASYRGSPERQQICQAVGMKTRWTSTGVVGGVIGGGFVAGSLAGVGVAACGLVSLPAALPILGGMTVWGFGGVAISGTFSAVGAISGALVARNMSIREGFLDAFEKGATTGVAMVGAVGASVGVGVAAGAAVGVGAGAGVGVAAGAGCAGAGALAAGAGAASGKTPVKPTR